MQIRSQKEVLGLASCHIRKKSLQVHLHRVGGGCHCWNSKIANLKEKSVSQKLRSSSFSTERVRKIRHRVTRCLHTHTHTCLVCVSALGNSLKPWFPTKTGIWVGTTHLKCYCCNPPLSAATKQLGCGFAAMVWWKSVPGHVEPLAKETAR